VQSGCLEFPLTVHFGKNDSCQGFALAMPPQEREHLMALAAGVLASSRKRLQRLKPGVRRVLMRHA